MLQSIRTAEWSSNLLINSAYFQPLQISGGGRRQQCWNSSLSEREGQEGGREGGKEAERGL